MKKKLLAAALALCMVFGSAAALPEGVFEASSTITASAEATSGNYTYEISDGKAIIMSYNGKEKKVVIPSKLGGKPVAEIDDDAFSGNGYIQNIFLPATLETIGKCAFQECKKLAEIKIPAKTATIKQQAFEGCTLLRKVTFETGADKSIGWRAFGDCTRLTELDLGGSVTYIGEGAFQGCNHLKGKKVGDTYKLVIPDSVSDIGGFASNADGAFWKCTALTEVTTGIGLVNLGANTFLDCSKLSKVTLGRNVKEIGESAFVGTKLTSITIPASVTQIGEEAFKEVTTLKTVKIESGKNKTIDNYAFNGCTGLTSIDLGKSVTSIGSYAFDDCTALTSINIPDSVTGIYSGAFENCTKLAKASIGNGVKRIRDNAFLNCSALKTVSFGAGLEQIDSSAFEDCTSLEKVELKPNTQTIGSGAFSGCTSLKSVIMPGVQEIVEKAFQYDIKLSEVVMGEGCIGKIGDYAFLNNENLTKVVIPESAVEIGTQSFGYNDQDQKRKGFTIYGVKGSDANAYANDNGFKFVAIAKHTCNYEKVVVPSTCTEKGYTVNVCKICGKVKETNTVKAAGHKWSDWKVVKTATCAATGLKTHYCTVCGKYDTSTIAKTNNHKFSTWKTAKKATCTAAGSKTRTCSVCKKTETATIAKLGHSYKATVVKPSCSAKGYTLHKCTKCGYSYKDKYTNTVAHKFSNWTTKSFNVDKGTSTQTGKCTLCGKIQTRTVKNAVVRYAGANRYDTAAMLSKASHKTTSDTVIIADAMTFQDALIAVPLAKAYNAPLLLANPNIVTKQTEAELARLKAKKVIIVNTSNALKKGTLDALKKKYTTQIIRGNNCFETSKRVAEELQKKTKKAPTDVFFTTNKAFADALSISPVAALKGAPILYVDPSKKTLDSNILAYLNKVKGSIKNVYIVGGKVAVPAAIENSIKKALPKKNVKRFDGAQRYETCVMINKYFASLLNSKTVCVAKGLDFPDALAGGVFAANQKAPLLLADSALRDAQKSFLKNKKPNKLYIFGGTVAVPDKLAKEVAKMSV